MEINLSLSGRLIPVVTARDRRLIGEERTVALLKKFYQSSAEGLLGLLTLPHDIEATSSLVFWRKLIVLLVSEIDRCSTIAAAGLGKPGSMLETGLNQLVTERPPMRGGELVDRKYLDAIWQSVWSLLSSQAASADVTLRELIVKHFPAWTEVGRLCLHLAEYVVDQSGTHSSQTTDDQVPGGSGKPFLFLVTYAHRLGSDGQLQHLPLGRAVDAELKSGNRDRLAEIMRPLRQAADEVPWLRRLIESEQIFGPVPLGVGEALEFIRSSPILGEQGLTVKVPKAWYQGRPSRAKVGVQLESGSQSQVGFNNLVRFNVGLTIDGRRLDEAEIKALLVAEDDLIQLKGQWIEIDRQRIGPLLDKWQAAANQSAMRGIPFSLAMRLMSGVGLGGDRLGELVGDGDLVAVDAGENFREQLRQLSRPLESQTHCQQILKKYLRATLRPYQLDGVLWLFQRFQLGLGGCLADDMGLGKTIQIIALMILIKYEVGRQSSVSGQHLLVVPASLIGNWEAELERFAPCLDFAIAHPSGGVRRVENAASLAAGSILISTYGMVSRLPWLRVFPWLSVTIDEAQAIKNPSTKQSEDIRGLSAGVRFALSGTPIENHLEDLWALFDFVAPGLLGRRSSFGTYVQTLKTGNLDQSSRDFSKLKTLVGPYILRRVKTDKSIIADLPPKTEVNAYCYLTRKQAALYQRHVDDLRTALRADEQTDINRQGLVLKYLTKFRQICNHPTHFVGSGNWAKADSGKFQRLAQLAETFAVRQDKVLIFTQYRAVMEPIHRLLRQIFDADGLMLHGQTPVAERTKLVRRFEEDDRISFFILSVKAGGTGLNLTAASQVVHFDRWWNPAVENQATDRAYRIGQTKRVVVHKFICRGTIEEKIDRMIRDKKTLAAEVIGDGTGLGLTRYSNEELVQLVSLDGTSATDDESV